MTSDPAGARYRRRRRWPVLVVTVVLLLATGVIWFQALKPVAAESTGCNTPGPAPTTVAQTSRTKKATTTFAGAPSTSSQRATTSSSPTSTEPTTLGKLTDKNTLASVRPANPASIPLSVFNASDQKGMAKTVSDELRAVGFASINLVANDPLYPAGDLRCIGEIRYGSAGVAGARTALIMLPCAQLVVDDRVDDSVDIAIGGRYEFADTSAAVKDQLKAISQAATPPAVIDGRTLAPRPTMPIPPLPNAACAG